MTNTYFALLVAAIGFACGGGETRPAEEPVWNPGINAESDAPAPHATPSTPPAGRSDADAGH